MSKNADTTPEKFRRLRDRSGLSMDDLAKAMGFRRASSIQRYANPDEYTKEFFAPELALKMIKALVGKGEPPIEAREIWELTGVPHATPGLRLVSSFDPDDEPSEEDGVASYTREHWKPRVNGAIPEIDVKLGAGEGIVGEVINLPVGEGSISGHRVVAEWLIPEDYLRNELKVSVNNTLIEEVVGDSMFPTYSPGDRVIIDLTQNRLTTDTVYSISDGVGEPQIKRLQRVPFSDPPEVNIISDNPNLETFRVELDRVHIIGRICGHLSRR